jgi:ketosteroid isomerase-like protein
MDTQVLEVRRDAFASMFQGGLDSLLRGDIEGWVAMWAEDGRMEFPFAPPGGVTERRDKAEIREHMRAFPQMFRLDRVADLRIHHTLDADVVVVEFGVEGQALATGKPYNQRYIAVITLKDGLIASYRDYWNPLVVLEALDLGGSSALHAEFKQENCS